MKVTLKRLESKNHIYFDEDIDEILNHTDTKLLNFYLKFTPAEVTYSDLRKQVKKLVDFVKPVDKRDLERLPIILHCPSKDEGLEVYVEDISTFEDSYEKSRIFAYFMGITEKHKYCKDLKFSLFSEKYGVLNGDDVNIQIGNDDLLSQSVVKINWNKRINFDENIKTNRNIHNVYDVIDVTFKATPHSIEWFEKAPNYGYKKQAEDIRISFNEHTYKDEIKTRQTVYFPSHIVKAEMEIDKKKTEQVYFHVVFESTNFLAESYDTPPDLDQIDAYHVTSISM